MKWPVAISAVVLIVLTAVFGAKRSKSTDVEVVRLDAGNWEQFAPDGKEVDAIFGDLVLRNAFVTAVIAQPLESRNANMTVRNVGGALIDLTVREPQSDQLSAFYPGRRTYPFRSASVQVSEEAATTIDSGSELHVSGRQGAVIVHAAAGGGRPAVDVTYRLGADDAHLTVTTRYQNPGDAPIKVTLQDDIRADGGKEDMPKAPNGVNDLFWIHDRYWGQAYGVTAKGLKIQSESNARTSVLKYQTSEGTDEITLQPGEEYTLTRQVFPGSNLLDVKAVAASLQGKSSSPLELKLQDGNGQSIPGAYVEFFKGETSIGSGKTDDGGVLRTRLLPGDYRLGIHALGASIAGPGRGITLRIQDSDQNHFEINLDDYRPGTVVARITDVDGKPIPCKVEFIGQPGIPRPDFGPESAAYAVGNLRYAALGEFKQSLPSGQYKVIISHGPEYDAVFKELTVSPGQTVALMAKLEHTVSTPGWVSSDFHSHSSPSGDNTGSQLGRVLNLVAEHVEYAPCTEHNRVSTYEPHIKALGIDEFIGTVSGMELTGQPLLLNHQNAFPMVMKPHTQDGGGPQTDSDPATQIERLALWDDHSEKLLQVNHPDLGWMFYDANGDGEPDDGMQRVFEQMDVIEVHPVSNILDLQPMETFPGRKGNNRIFNWLQLLNQGFRVPGVVNTDAHYNYHGSGGLRNWIQSETDEPSQIQALDVVRAAEQGRLILSNGPYLEVTYQAAAGSPQVSAGGDLQASDGKLTVHVRVQCPNWFDIDRVFVIVNGRVSATHNYTRDKHPHLFRNGVVKFDEKLEIELPSDAHIIVATGGKDSKLGPVLGPFWGNFPPAAIANPVYVDVDGGGFRANGDTLGHPLPVRFRDR